MHGADCRSSTQVAPGARAAAQPVSAPVPWRSKSAESRKRQKLAATETDTSDSGDAVALRSGEYLSAREFLAVAAAARATREAAPATASSSEKATTNGAPAAAEHAARAVPPAAAAAAARAAAAGVRPASVGSVRTDFWQYDQVAALSPGDVYMGYEYDTAAGFGPSKSPDAALRLYDKTRIAKGSYGYVDYGRLPISGREIVLKTPRVDRVPHASAEDENEAREMARVVAWVEICAMKSLGKHPNLVDMLDHDDPATTPLPRILYAYAGLAFTTALSRGWLFDIGSACAHIASALEHMHAHGVWHHDIKFENMLIAKDGAVRLCDVSLGSIAFQHVVQTLPWRAPEAIRRRQATTPAATDVWGLGVMLYQLLTRHHLVPLRMWETMSSNSDADTAVVLPYLRAICTTGFAEDGTVLRGDNPPLRYLRDYRIFVARLQEMQKEHAPYARLVSELLHIDPLARPTAAVAFAKFAALPPLQLARQTPSHEF